MAQSSLFPDLDPEFESFDLPDATLWLKRRFLTVAQAEELFAGLLSATPWEQEVIRMYGREVQSPRLTAWYGDPGSDYLYSGISHRPLPWTRALNALRQEVQERTGIAYNSALLNLYRDGQDSVAWHSDDEPQLGECPQIASVSLGATRTFQLKHKRFGPSSRIDLELPNGSLLFMGGACQRHWLHQIPKRKKVLHERINLTFRQVVRTGQSVQ
jgi:alkylated DNA repair dioxygenase AlkB